MDKCATPIKLAEADIGPPREVRGGQGRGGEAYRRGCELAGRAQAGGASTTRVHGHCARTREGGTVGRAPSDSISVSLPVDSARM
jgi:hypothetical protein